MLIKNEISFDGVNGQQNYGVLVMIILYILSLFGCVLIAIIILKLIITCFFTDKYNQLFCIRSEDKDIRSGADRRRRLSDISVVSNKSLNESKFSNLENLFRKISETRLRAQQHCICPVCSNDHVSTSSSNISIMDSLNSNLKKGQTKRSSFILRSAQVLSKKLILKRDNKIQTESDENGNKNENETKKAKIIPIVSRTQTEKIILQKVDRPMGESKQIANYSDVVLELKQKFSSMTMLNTIV